LEWQHSSRFRQEQQYLPEGEIVRLGVRCEAFNRRQALSNDLKVWTSRPWRQVTPGLMEFLKVGFRNQHFGVEVLQPGLKARVAFHGLAKVAEGHRPKPRFIDWEQSLMSEVDETLDDASREINYLRNEVNRLQSIIDINLPDIDPELLSLYETAQVSASLIRRLPTEAAKTYLSHHRKGLAKIFHPDINRPEMEQQLKAANAAIEGLLERLGDG
jgi:hypothetical protein